jgi:DNA polymerase IV
MEQELPKLLLVDMNSFFASVEQQANPVFRGKPVGICARLAPGESGRASLERTSCLIAASKEAKRLGIKTGTLVYEAQKICPEIILLVAEPEKYREVNRRINRIFLDYTDMVESYSIDESFIDLRETKLNPLVVGAEIKRRIRSEAGEWLTCSVGIGANKFLAKLASDMEKPDGLTVVWRSQLPIIYRSKKLRELWGVGRGWERRLGKIGITSPLQVLNYPLQNLVSLFGRPGFYLWRRLNGLEEDKISSNYTSPLTGEDVRRTDEGELSNPSPGALHHPLPFGERVNRESTMPKSFGNSWVLNFRSRERERLKPVILRLAEKAARRMRAKNLRAKGFSFYVDFADNTNFYRTKKIKYFIETGLSLYEEILREWGSGKLSSEVRKIAVSFCNLSLRSQQLGLFDEDKYFKLTKEIDLINDKYGEFSIRSGLIANTSDYAPDAIAFGK